MEYCGGGSCADVYSVLERPFTEPQIAYVMRDTIKCLQFLHDASIVHRDMKAANILLTEQGLVKITDFGVSAVLASKDEKRFSVIGTPLWMAPEVIDNTGMAVPYDHRVDIWSLGISAIELAEMQVSVFKI